MSRTLWPLLTGFGIWAIAFILLYAIQAIGCAWAWPEATHRMVLIALWIGSLGLLGLLLRGQWRASAGGGSAEQRVRIVLTMAAMAATFATYFPVAFVTLCI